VTKVLEFGEEIENIGINITKNLILTLLDYKKSKYYLISYWIYLLVATISIFKNSSFIFRSLFESGLY